MSKTTTKTTSGWSDDRLHEFFKLNELVQEIACINDGNMFIETLQRCIDIAQELQTTDFKTPRASFMRFLKDLTANKTEL